jgi:hypothetical protein
MGRHRFGRRLVFCAVVGAAAIAAATLPSLVPASNVGDGGQEVVSCSKYQPQTIHAEVGLSNYCSSNWSGFYAYNPFQGGGLPACRRNYYTAEVHAAPPSGSPDVVRWRGTFCADGAWQYSPTSATNEWRYTALYIGDAGVSYQIIQYRHP